MEKVKQYFKNTFVLWIIVIVLTMITITQEVRIYHMLKLDSVQTDAIIALDNRTINNHNFALEIGENTLEIFKQMLPILKERQ